MAADNSVIHQKLVGGILEYPGHATVFGGSGGICFAKEVCLRGNSQAKRGHPIIPRRGARTEKADPVIRSHLSKIWLEKLTKCL